MHKHIFAIGMLSAAMACAASAGATTWEPANTCWQDFDVGGGWFCGIRSTQCAGGGVVECSNQQIPLSPPAQYKSVPPSSPKAMAMDLAGWVYLVGSDNRIYNEDTNGNDWQQFSYQPPFASCIKKIVASGDLRNNPKLLVLACNGNVFQYLQGSWALPAGGGLDISVGSFDSSGEYFFVLNGSGGHALSTTSVDSQTSWYTMTNSTSFNTTPNGALQFGLIGGNVGFVTNVFSACNVNELGAIPTDFFQFWGGPYYFQYGNDPGGCSGLQISGMFNAQGGPALQKVVYSGVAPGRGPGPDLLWILTNQTRVYALTTSDTRNGL